MTRLYVDSGGAATNSGTSDNNSPDLSGAAEATVVSNKTFIDANVNTGTDQITVLLHGYTSGSGLILTTTGVLPAGLTLSTLYYLFAVDINTITLHTNVADAEAGTNPVNITAAAGGGTHTINNMSINLSSTPDLSGIIGTHCRITTTGTSHVFTMAGSLHGFTNGQAIYLQFSNGGTLPTGLTAFTTSQCSIMYYVNALTTSTFRVYTTSALAVAGGVSDVNITVAETRTMDVHCDTKQDAVNIASSSVTNRKNFWLRAVSNTNKLLIIDDTLTLSSSPSDWAIGGRVSAAGLADLFNNLRNEEHVIFNTDISAAALNLSFRPNSGNYNFGFVNTIWAGQNTPGVLKLEGKSGARRLLVNTSTGNLFALSPNTSGVRCYVYNMELQCQGTGSVNSTSNNSSLSLIDSVISDSGTSTLVMALNGATSIIRSTISGVSANITNAGSLLTYKSYIHDITGDWQNTGNSGVVYVNNILERFTGRPIDNTFFSQGNNQNGYFASINNTIYHADNSGYEETSRVVYGRPYLFDSNIFKDNGDASTEANIELLSDPSIDYTRVFIEGNNDITIAGGRGGANTLLLTLDATDITTDPLFVDPDNATASLRDFNLQTGSPARGNNFPYAAPNSGTISYKDLGASQHQDSGSGSGGGSPIIGGWF